TSPEESQLTATPHEKISGFFTAATERSFAPRLRPLPEGLASRLAHDFEQHHRAASRCGRYRGARPPAEPGISFRCRHRCERDFDAAVGLRFSAHGDYRAGRARP